VFGFKDFHGLKLLEVVSISLVFPFVFLLWLLRFQSKSLSFSFCFFSMFELEVQICCKILKLFVLYVVCFCESNGAQIFLLLFDRVVEKM
jgi:hypothetical protein